MTIEFTENEVDALYNAGFTDEDLQFTIEDDRANGKSDEEIKSNILNAINLSTKEPKEKTLTQQYVDGVKNDLKKKLGRDLQIASFTPLMNIPYLGTGLGGGLYSVGDALVNDNPDLLGAAGRGFVLGETIGAAPYVGKVLAKVPGIKQGVNLVGKAANKVAQTKAGQVVGDLTNRALNNAYVKAVGDF